MPFPPSFDHTWDITQPPDTQAANLLGQDIRNLKDDIMQRMSLLSGTLANRPSPETLNATWGGAGFGLIYLATDTGQFFQWTGAAWTDVTATLIFAPRHFSDLTQPTITNPGVTTTINTITVPVQFTTGSIVRITTGCSWTSGTIPFNITANGSQITSGSISSGSNVYFFDLTLLALSTTFFEVFLTGSIPNTSVFTLTQNIAYVAGTPFTVLTQTSGAGVGSIKGLGMSAFIA